MLKICIVRKTKSYLHLCNLLRSIQSTTFPKSAQSHIPFILPWALAVRLKIWPAMALPDQSWSQIHQKPRKFLAHTLPLKIPLAWKQSACAGVDHKINICALGAKPFGLQGPNVSGNEGGLWNIGTFSWSFAQMMNMYSFICFIMWTKTKLTKTIVDFDL